MTTPQTNARSNTFTFGRCPAAIGTLTFSHTCDESYGAVDDYGVGPAFMWTPNRNGAGDPCGLSYTDNYNPTVFPAELRELCAWLHSWGFGPVTQPANASHYCGLTAEQWWEEAAAKKKLCDEKDAELDRFQNKLDGALHARDCYKRELEACKAKLSRQSALNTSLQSEIATAKREAASNQKAWESCHEHRGELFAANVKLGAEVDRLRLEIDGLRAVLGDKQEALTRQTARADQLSRLLDDCRAKCERLRNSQKIPMLDWGQGSSKTAKVLEEILPVDKDFHNPMTVRGMLCDIAWLALAGALQKDNPGGSTYWQSLLNTADRLREAKQGASR